MVSGVVPRVLSAALCKCFGEEAASRRHPITMRILAPDTLRRCCVKLIGDRNIELVQNPNEDAFERRRGWTPDRCLCQPGSHKTWHLITAPGELFLLYRWSFLPGGAFVMLAHHEEDAAQLYQLHLNSTDEGIMSRPDATSKP
jgi:hypothetical protein